MRRILSRLEAMVVSSDLLAAGTHLGQNGIDTVLVDGAHGVHGQAQFDPAVLAGNPEPAFMQVGKDTAAGSVVGVRDVVAALHTFSGYLAHTGHGTHRSRSSVAPDRKSTRLNSSH